MKILILFIVLYLHIYDDYYAQGILANMKQREWWEKQYTGSIANKDKQRELYGKDYLMALAEHAFSWVFITHLPYLIMIVINPALVPLYIVSIIVNTVIHAIVDDMKANKKKINLITDQSIHFGQILVTWLVWCLI